MTHIFIFRIKNKVTKSTMYRTSMCSQLFKSISCCCGITFAVSHNPAEVNRGDAERISCMHIVNHGFITGLNWEAQNTSVKQKLTIIVIKWHHNKLECGPMPNVIATLPDTGGTLYSMPQSLADAHYKTTTVLCSNAAKTQNPMKFAGVPQTPEPISAVRGPKFAILWWHLEKILLFNKLFFRLSIHALVAKI